MSQPPPAIEQIAAAIVDLLTNDDGARRTSCAIADDVLARYDWKRAAAATLSVLEEAAGGR